VSEFAFPLLGTAIVVLVVLPAFSLLAKLALLFLDRGEVGGPLRWLRLRFLLLAGSSALPLAWFFSAGLHQAESGQSVLACLFVHDVATLCYDSGWFALTLGAVVVTRSLRVLRSRAGADASVEETSALSLRLERVLDSQRMLRPLRGRILVSGATGFSIGTRGWLKPRVIVGTSFASRLTDDMLAAALGHENEHVRSFDPLRYLVLELSLAINPVGRFLLEAHVARWHAAQEAHCDREAVILGCHPLSLADAIVRAARPGALPVVPLGAPDMRALELRVGMLLAFAEELPTPCCRRGLSTLPTAVALLLLALLLPHRAGTGVLDAVHQGAEQALTYFFLS
jgi:Zn-dependent protease with chaperone function